jgi:hypothetical protein
MEWEDRYDLSVKALVREILTILESVIVVDSQRQALRRIMRKTIYQITDDLKEDIVSEVGPIKPTSVADKQQFTFPRGEE